MVNREEWQRETAPFEKTLARYVIKTLLNLGKGSSALDLGCNDGFITEHLCKRFPHVVAVDASQRHIERASQRVTQAIFHVALVEEFEPGDELFDTIYMVNILEHLDNPLEVLRRTRQWLNPDGYIIICVPNALSLNKRIGQKMGLISNCYELTAHDIEIGHKRLYNLELLKKDIIDAGLRVESTGSIFLKPFSNPQMEKFMNCEAWSEGLRGWGGQDRTIDWRERLCGALYEIAKELPQYSSPIWARCTR